MKGADLILGVDGGGTKTIAWLATATDAVDGVLGRGQAGPSNPRAVGLPSATANLDKAVESAFVDARLSRCRVESACLGLAGVDRDDDRAAIDQWANERGLASRIKIVNDAVTVLYTGTTAGCGVALLSGTGSLAFGQNTTGETARSGGWGHVFGDEGSGYAIAISALRAAARDADGRGPKTTLLDRFLRRFDLNDPSQLVSVIYDPAFDRQSIASQASLVFEASDDGDRVAATIVNHAALDLADMVITVARRLAMDMPIALAMTGGVLLKQPAFRDLLLEEISRHNVKADPVTLVSDAVVGAIRLASLCV